MGATAARTRRQRSERHGLIRTASGYCSLGASGPVSRGRPSNRTRTRTREDACGPVALDLADWLQKAERVADAEPRLKVATEAQKWLQANSGELRNQRIALLAGKAQAIWLALRQESTVDLGAICLEGRNTSRRVVLEAAVDGSDTEAFGVMSQGELQALALAAFIPRATSPESPFRFLVLNDPIQAMDPSKIDGCLQVLTSLAEDRQVIVFTHDDRLPAAIRRSRAPARIHRRHPRDQLRSDGQRIEPARDPAAGGCLCDRGG